MQSISMNRLSMRMVQTLMDSPDTFKVQATKLADGSTIIDTGIEAQGGYEAGRLVAEICMGGLGSVQLSSTNMPDIPCPWVTVFTDHPVLSCMLSQMAGWSMKLKDFRAMSSGPARALAQTEDIYKQHPYKDAHTEAVIVLETSTKPTQGVSALISDKCGVDPKNLYMVAVRTASLAGAVQVCARVVETGMHKMNSLGIDLAKIAAGHGTCPVPPLSKSDLVMMGRTNDAILYGGRSSYVFADASSALPHIESVPSSSSADYGRPFAELFKAAGSDFYKIDPGLFSPAVISMEDAKSGKCHTAGKVDVKVLRKSFGMS